MTQSTETREFHRARDAEERGEGICRTCLEPIWNEGGTVGHIHRDEGWSDRIERGGDSLVCFKAADYRHAPLVTREAAIYDRAVERGMALANSAGGAVVRDDVGFCARCGVAVSRYHADHPREFHDDAGVAR